MQFKMTLLRPQIATHTGKTLRINDAGEHEVVSSYKAGSQFLAREVVVNGLPELAELLKSAAISGHEFYVRGAPGDRGKRGLSIKRRFKDPDSAETGLVAQDTRLLALDTDGVPAPGLGGAESIAAAGVFIRDNVLPPEFRGASMVVSCSSKTGLCGKDIFRGRLWFITSEPHADETIREWAKGFRASTNIELDSALYNAAQPHYLARPKIEGGVDPISPENFATCIDGFEAVALNTARYVATTQALDICTTAIKASSGSDWRRLALQTVGGANGYREPIMSVIGVAVRCGADASTVVDFLLKLQIKLGVDGRYKSAWLRQAFTEFEARSAREEARAEAAFAELRRRFLSKKAGYAKGNEE